VAPFKNCGLCLFFKCQIVNAGPGMFLKNISSFELYQVKSKHCIVLSISSGKLLQGTVLIFALVIFEF